MTTFGQLRALRIGIGFASSRTCTGSAGRARHLGKLSLLAWRRFHGAPSWFSEADRRGVVRDWLASENDRLADMAVNYLRAHHSHAPDRVAALRPYADLGDRWSERLRPLLETTDHHTSRQYFELLLQLVDNGTMDVVSRDVVKNDTIRFVLHDVGENRPEWLAEFVAHFLRRRIAVIRAASEDFGESELIGFDETATRLFERKAQG